MRHASQMADALTQVMGWGQSSKFSYWPNDAAVKCSGNSVSQKLRSLGFNAKNNLTRAEASRCFITRLMQRLLYLQLRDHLLPPYLALLSIYPRPPIPGNESRASSGWVDHIAPSPSAGYRPWSPHTPSPARPRERNETWAETSEWTPMRCCISEESQSVQGPFIRHLRNASCSRQKRF